jgi:hypothetical protein
MELVVEQKKLLEGYCAGTQTVAMLICHLSNPSGS